MATTHDKSPGIICAENISALHFLNSVPESPSRKELNKRRHYEHGYTLSIAEELRLVEAHAFLSNANDNPNRVPAICVQEVSGTSTLNVLLAVNQSEWCDGSQSLQQLKGGFVEVFTQLTKLGDDAATHSSVDHISTTIISMCSQRILRRLRLIKGKRSKSKPPIQEILWTAIGSLQQHNKSLSNQSSSSSTFVNGARHVIKLADAWLKHQVVPRLKELVEAIHHLKNNRDLETIVGTIPNQEMCPSTRSNLINIIFKVARYRDVARYLYRLSKRSTLERHMNLLPVVLPKDMYSRLRTQSCASTLSAVFTRIATSGQKSNLGRIYQSMNLTEDQANEEFVALTNKTLSEAKIHAEIQLLYFLELNPSNLPPRIIASSKDACYLCNAFIQMHGKMHTARTHGRLYPGWRLPTIPKLIGLEQRFNMILAKHIRSSVATLILRGQKTVYPDPNESTLLTLPYSESTLRSLLSSREVIGKQETFMQLPRSRSASTSQDSKAESEVVTSSIETEPKDEDLATSSSIINLTRASAGVSAREVSLCSINENGKDLIQGREMILGGEENLYNAGHLELHTDVAARKPHAQLAGTHQHPKYSLEWLIPKDVESYKARGNDVVIEVNSLQRETIYELNEEGCLLIAARGVLVKIACQR